MERIARVIPIKSRAALDRFVEQLKTKMADGESAALFHKFGAGVERWYYQEVGGQPCVISVTEGADLSAGYGQYADTGDEFFDWFSKQVQALSDVDLRVTPTGATSEFIVEIAG